MDSAQGKSVDEPTSFTTFSSAQPGQAKPVLAFDLGGTKIAAAIVHQGCIVEQQTMPTDTSADPDEWVRSMAQLARPWSGQYSLAGAAVTGRIEAGLWSALNPLTLNLPDKYPLPEQLRVALGCQVMAVNDAQAATWGEYRFGAGISYETTTISDLVFITVSTGIGAGIVLGGRLILGHAGLAGSIGQIPYGNQGDPWENHAAGRWFAQAAASKGLARPGGRVEAAEVFAAAARGDQVAETLIRQSAREVARLCENLQATLDPAVIVLGGGIGLAHGYLERVSQYINTTRPCTDVHLIPAVLGSDAGLIGVADLALREFMHDQQTEDKP
ncbi:MAG: ROK family protein [Granulosicoccus sp.]